ncbi:MAG TPA: efflux RND transporter periplasmic adaptor subunit [Bacteroidales bacterium]|jgi:RND family efflux transporter MFP subunit|nr:Solvent efflux pump periplasmic linker SrpA [Bacteroidales bacterium]MCZ2417855.1 efflux RND transporter periplasmic adaptor subunit [Burkholderiales bacterium]OQC57053.1 MAG: Solvent efflux pump periplasmic linker SrpA precursor [Bacteroidetes bacterium ADurb.Bin013]NLZ08462.1 efflux RND transporter periplasmic adaptor subunit [Bacteroidales bacterium]HNR27924.1 efflux RND transporter periplasmic adaptor subunit [Bacteroidales bacterium]
MNKYRLIPLITVALLLAGCGIKGQNQQEAAPEKIVVKAAAVTLEEVPQINEFTATVQANIINNIAPQMAARIKKIYVEVGDFVTKGQKLVQMDDNNLEQVRTQLENMEISFRRVDELYKVGGVSQADWDAQKTRLDVMRTQYDNLVENTQLVSPIDGVITARHYDSGDLFGMSMPLLVVEQISPVKLLVHVSESFFTKIRKGMEVDIRLDVYPGEVFKGRVSIVYPTITAATRTFPVEIVIPNVNRKVRPGMFARVAIDFGAEPCLLIPDQSVIKQQGSGERHVYVYKDGKAEYRLVEPGRRLDSFYECLSGLEKGELVITTSLNRLTNGAEVELANE